MKEIKKSYFKIVIAETHRSNPKASPAIYNHITEIFPSITSLKEYIKERYGRMPGIRGTNLIFEDTMYENAIPVGFTYSFWNHDISHNSKKYYQTDWVSISRIDEFSFNPLRLKYYPPKNKRGIKNV